jgi:hypothetical protein
VPTEYGPGALAGAAEAGDWDIAGQRPSRAYGRAVQLPPEAADAPGWWEPSASLAMPPVDEANPLGDRVWFAQHPGRSFLSRRGADGGHWIVRRAGDVLLRVPIPPALSLPARDSDGELGPLWFASAWPSLSAEKAQLLGRRATRRGRRGPP